MSGRRNHRTRALCALGLLATILVVPGTLPAAAGATPAPIFTKVFVPDTIGPDSTSALTFTIDNSFSGLVRESIDFSDTLPDGMIIATPSGAATNCTDATLAAPDGGSTITLTGAAVGALQICTVTVNVTAGAEDNSDTSYTNTSGDLTSSGGNSGPATDTLDVDVDRPGFSKSFSPTTVAIGGRSTLTFTIDNSGNASGVPNLNFTDALPPGMFVADPADAATDCLSILGTTITAVPGSSTITLDADGSAIGGNFVVGAEGTCTVVVDVVGSAVGQLFNAVALEADFTAAGNATAVLDVTGAALEITKQFTDDPVPPGGTVDLEFELSNLSRTDTATGLGFTDSLPASTVFASLLSNDCGGSVSGTGTSVITFSGGTLASEASCKIRVSLTVPAGATAGSYPNITSALSGTVGGSPVTGNVATDVLFINSFPILTKEFVGDPTASGTSVTLRFTITNPSTTSAMSAITFIDELTDSGIGGTGFLPFPISATLPATPCGAGSSLGYVFPDTDRQAIELTLGTLTAGSTCTFDIPLVIPAGFPNGTYTNTTGTISAVLDDLAGTPTFVGPAASDDIVIVAAPTLRKEFIDDPIDPGAGGAPATVRFTLTHDAIAPGDASDIAFSDDLTTLTGVPGLSAASVGPNSCGGTVDITTLATNIAFSGGTLAVGATCTIDVVLTVPAGATPGSHTNTTSTISATVLGVSVTELAASDDLQIATLVLTKAFGEITGATFTERPVIAGDTTTLRFTFDNQSPLPATHAGTVFADALSLILPGVPDVVASGTPIVGCGGTLSGTTSLVFTNLSVAANSMCTVDVTVTVPAATPDATYTNITSAVSSSLGTSDPATAQLTVDSTLLELTKEFTNDPVTPGDEATLVFTLENLSATETVTDIAFSDDLDATLSGLTAESANSNGCGGMAVGFPATTFDYGGGSLAPGGTCTISIQVKLPTGSVAGTVFPNTTSGVTGKVGLLDVFGDPATDDLKVQTLTLSKSFDGPTTATSDVVLTFTIENLDTVAPVSNLAFADDLEVVVSGLVASGLPATPCGAGSTISGTGFLTFTGGSLAAGASCTFAVTLTAPATASAGSFLNTTSELFSAGIAAADPASAFLDIQPPPTFAKAFAPDTIVATTPSTLTFTIDNSASTVAATGFVVNDTFPVGMEIADPPNAATTCATGMGDAGAGNPGFLFSGGEVAAGASCTISIDVTSAIADTYVNTTEDLLSSSGNSGAATDTLTVTAQTPPTVTINQAAGQADPANTAPINFTVVFNEVVTDFTAADVAVVNGTASSVTGSGTTYNVAVAPTAEGLVTATVPAGGAVDGDGTGNLASTSTDNTVNFDSTDPVINTPGTSITTNNDPGEAGAIVNYVVTTTDEGATTSALRISLAGTEVSGQIVPPGGLSCTPASGTFFPIGTTVVTCTATDLAGNMSSTTFNVIVVDNEDPILSLTATTVTANAPTTDGATVTFDLPTASDNSGSATVTCAPPSGSLFPVGVTVVTCTAVDGAGNTATVNFDVVVALDPSVLPKTGGGLGLLVTSMQILLAGMVLFGLSRLGRRRRLKLS